jgi:hypothetical protein
LDTTDLDWRPLLWTRALLVALAMTQL